jgi:hypothetical protein
MTRTHRSLFSKSFKEISHLYETTDSNGNIIDEENCLFNFPFDYTSFGYQTVQKLEESEEINGW